MVYNKENCLVIMRKVTVVSIVIGSFNIRDLNFSNENKDGEIQKRDFPLIADMIIKEGFDVVAIQEVNSPMALERIVFFLNKKKSIPR